MTETYTETGDPISPYRWRDPIVAWRFLLASYVVTISVFVAVLAIQLLNWANYAGRVTLSAEFIAWINPVVGAINAAVAPTFLVSACLTLWLTFRLVANVHSQGKREGLPGPVLATLYYVIPFASLVMPPLVMGQLWRASSGEREDRGPGGMVGLWWSAFLISNFSAISYALRSQPASGTEWLSTLSVGALSFFCRLLAAITLLVLLGTIVRRQRSRPAADAFT